jgi:hypothetical protein
MVMTEEGATAVQSTRRDVQVLRWLGEQYGLDLATFGELLAYLSPEAIRGADHIANARRYARRLERLGYAGRRTVAGERWVFPTAAGLEFAGLPFDEWQPRGWMLPHARGVARLRMRLERAYPGSLWESERTIRDRQSKAKVKRRVPDGVLELSSRSRIGIELELTRKSRKRYAETLAAVDSGLDGYWWFVPAGEVEWLRGYLRQAVRSDRPRHEVHEIPPGVIDR